MEDLVDRMRNWKKKYKQTPKGKYANQKINAKQRGIKFKLTFDEWWYLWEQSGQWENRGNRLGKYVMCRYGDAGPYELGNVYIGLFSLNLQEARNKNNVKRKHTAKSTMVTFG